MDAGDKQRHAQIGVDQSPRGLMPSVHVVGPAQAEVDRYQHQSSAMRDGNGEGPERKPRRRDTREYTRMAPPDQKAHPKADDQHTRADLDLALPGEQDR